MNDFSGSAGNRRGQQENGEQRANDRSAH
jgi:hypothetical protein